MFRGLLTSFIGHALLLAWALLSINRTPQLAPETLAIEATIITPSELTRLKQGSPQSKELEAKPKEEPKPEVSKKEAEKPKPVTEPPPPPPPPPAEPEKSEPAKAKEDPIADKLAALPPPEPGPTPEEKKKLEEKVEQERVAAEQRKKLEEEQRKKAEEKKKAEAKKKAEEKKKRLAEAMRKAEAKKKQFDADRIAALIDKSPDKRGAPQSAMEPTKPTDYKGPTVGERRGTDTVLSAREQDMLKAMINAQLQPCSKMPGGGGGIDTPVVSVMFRLRRDGALEGEPVLVDRQSSPLYSLAADASIRALKQCSPFQLPADKYAAWSTVTWEFDWPVILGLVQR